MVQMAQVTQPQNPRLCKCSLGERVLPVRRDLFDADPPIARPAAVRRRQWGPQVRGGAGNANAQFLFHAMMS